MPRTNPLRYRDPLRGTRTKLEAGRLLGCGETEVGRMMDDGRLAFVRVGNRRLPTVASIERQLGKPIEQLEAPLRAETAA